MLREMDFGNNNIGIAIQYFRETYHISQSKLCKGLCSVPTLSRIEAGERDVDSYLLETLLERLGKVPNQFELILTDFDYEAYLCRKEISKYIEDKEIEAAYKVIQRYDELTVGKASPHRQYIMVSRALLNELEGGKPETTIEILMEAITCTVPDFNTSEIEDYFLSITEFNIIIDIVERMISIGMIDRAHKILDHVINYLYWHSKMEQNHKLYPKVAVIAGRFYKEKGYLDKALDICNKGLQAHKGSNKMEYLPELYLIKAQIIEEKLKDVGQMDFKQKKECLKLYLKVYHLYNFFGDIDEAEKIRKHLQEEYKWADID